MGWTRVYGTLCRLLQSCRLNSAWVRFKTNAHLKSAGGSMILMAFLEPELPVRAGVPCSEFAMEGNGRRGRETGKEGALVRVRGGLGRPREASGDETCGLTVVGLTVDGPADMVMRAISGRKKRNSAASLSSGRSSSGTLGLQRRSCQWKQALRRLAAR